MQEEDRQPSKRSLRALEFLNVFLADVPGGIGPFLAVYLAASYHWNPANIGIAISVSALSGVITQTPAGELVDRLRQKRLLIVITSMLIAVSSLVMVTWTTMKMVVTAQVMLGAVSSVIGPAVAAITLGLVGHQRMDQQMGRNQAVNHAGNVGTAALAGLFGHYVGRQWIFYLVIIMCIASSISVLLIREQEIDHELARGGVSENNKKGTSPASGIMMLLTDGRIVIFALAVILFHFANAAMLPLVGQMLSDGKARGASLYMAACIIVAQLVMVPVSAWAGPQAGRWGRKPVFLIAFLVLPIRGVLYVLSENQYFLVSVQMLDGIAAGIFGVVMIIVIADLTKGTGRFNLTQGAIGTATGIGASLSTLLTGFIVGWAGYHAAFLTLAAVAAIALAVFWWCMPETKKRTDKGTKIDLRRGVTP
jgi:predicted MFS family arabinose efflux permease